MQQIHPNINRFLSSKAAAFLKRSFFFALLYSTLLYILVRLFFYEFPFTIGEGFELHNKMLLVVWIFIITCKLIFSGIILLENSNKMKFDLALNATGLKKTILIMLTAALSFTGKAPSAESVKIIADSGTNSNDEASMEPDVIF